MIFDEPFDRGGEESGNGDAFLLSDSFEDVLECKAEASDYSDRYTCFVLLEHPSDKGSEVVVDEFFDVRLSFIILNQEWSEASKIARWRGLGAIDIFNDCFIAAVEFLPEFRCYIFWNKVLDEVCNECFAKCRCATFISKYEPSCADSFHNLFSIPLTGVGSCSKDGCNAAVVSAHCSCGCHEVVLYFDFCRREDVVEDGCQFFFD